MAEQSATIHLQSNRPLAVLRQLAALRTAHPEISIAPEPRQSLDEALLAMQQDIVSSNDYMGREHFDGFAVLFGIRRSVSGTAFNACINPEEIDSGATGLYGFAPSEVHQLISPVSRSKAGLGIYPDYVQPVKYGRSNHRNAALYAIKAHELVVLGTHAKKFQASLNHKMTVRDRFIDTVIGTLLERFNS